MDGVAGAGTGEVRRRAVRHRNVVHAKTGDIVTERDINPSRSRVCRVGEARADRHAWRLVIDLPGVTGRGGILVANPIDRGRPEGVAAIGEVSSAPGAGTCAEGAAIQAARVRGHAVVVAAAEGDGHAGTAGIRCIGGCAVDHGIRRSGIHPHNRRRPIQRRNVSGFIQYPGI